MCFSYVSCGLQPEILILMLVVTQFPSDRQFQKCNAAFLFHNFLMKVCQYPSIHFISSCAWIENDWNCVQAVHVVSRGESRVFFSLRDKTECYWNDFHWLFFKCNIHKDLVNTACTHTTQRFDTKKIWWFLNLIMFILPNRSVLGEKNWFRPWER